MSREAGLRARFVVKRLDASSIKFACFTADSPDMDRLRHEHDFSLVELLVLAPAVGMLAAIALPSVLGQGEHSTTRSCIVGGTRTGGCRGGSW